MVYRPTFEDEAFGDLYEQDRLAAVVAFLRSGEPLSEEFREELAELMESGRIAFAALSGGGSKVGRKKRLTAEEEIEVGAWVAVRNLMTKRASYARILESAAKKFGVSEGTVKRCHLGWRRSQDRLKSDGGASYPWGGLHQWHVALREFCEERDLDYLEIPAQLYSGQKFDLDF
jgi:hypothetical protein